MKKEYTISELENLTGFSRRTVHFYIKEGLIPSPGSVGTGTKYGEEHFLRLMMIGILQKQDLKLNGIRKILESMTLIQMKETVSRESVNRTARGLTNLFSGVYSIPGVVSQAALKTLNLNEEITLPPENDRQKESGNRTAGGFLMNKTVLLVSEQQTKDYNHEVLEEKPDLVQEKEGNSNSIKSWRRIELTDGIEMNVREDIFSRYKSLISELIDKFNEQ